MLRLVPRLHLSHLGSGAGDLGRFLPFMALTFLFALGILLIPIAFATRVIAALFSSKSGKLIRDNKVGHFVWFLASALIMFLLSIPLHELKVSPARVGANIAGSSLNQLHRALRQYNLDIITSDAKASAPYPHALHDIVGSDYLSEKDFNRLTTGLPITYYEPPPDSPGTFILLEVSTQDYYAAISLEGILQTQVYKKNWPNEIGHIESGEEKFVGWE